VEGEELMRTTLGADEKILYEVRRHWLYLIGTIGIVFGISYIAILLFKTDFILFGTIFFAWYFLSEWKNNIWVITNKRLIDEWGVFTKSLKETPLDKINNVTYRKDIFGMLFNYGTVYVQSAAEDGATVMKMIPNPEEFLQKISEAKSVFVSSTLMECPVCREIIKKGAIICRFCGSDLRRFYKMSYDEDDFLKEKMPQKEVKVESFSDSTPTVEKDIYRRKVDFDLLQEEIEKIEEKKEEKIDSEGGKR
jgi:hypothetical protein